MKQEKRMLVAFVLNLAFSCFEFAGGLFTGSIAIVSDALHDLGDAAGIGISYLLERKSSRKPDKTYTYGYARYSVLGSALTTLILLTGSVAVIWHGAERLIRPQPLHYDGMIFLAVIGLCINLAAAYFTRGDGSMNRKAVNLHMLEDVLSWTVVLAGAVVMRFTDLVILDPLLSLGVALFIAVHAFRHLRETLGIFLEKAPNGMDADTLAGHLSAVEGVLDVHHIHLWTLDGQSHCAAMHIITGGNPRSVKGTVRKKLEELGIVCAALELEGENEPCHVRQCHPEPAEDAGHSHHGHHHH